MISEISSKVGASEFSSCIIGGNTTLQSFSNRDPIPFDNDKYLTTIPCQGKLTLN
jgi:hypothetical protein